MYIILLLLLLLLLHVLFLNILITSTIAFLIILNYVLDLHFYSIACILKRKHFQKDAYLNKVTVLN